MVNNYPNVSKAFVSLFKCITSNIENLRKIRVLGCLLSSSSVISNTFNIQNDLWGCRSDGGWSDVEETMWAIKVLDLLNYWDNSLINLRHNSIDWLNRQKTQDGAWGRTRRDVPRIPITGMLLTILPEIADDISINWLRNNWREDLSNPIKLTYKGALFLSASAKIEKNPDIELIKKTVKYLTSEQNSDGGFGPWKDHPIGSDPWSTGLSLLGLASFPEYVDIGVFLKCLEWLEENQLPNGLWPCHYIEEGSAYCYWGTIEALKIMKKTGHPCAV